MRNTKRARNRWLTAITVTCLTGATLCGCARGTRDVSTDLKDSAAREAVEAERSLAERRRKPTEEKARTRELAANDVKSKATSSTQADVPVRPKTKRRSEFDFEETNTDSAELALRSSTKSRNGQPTSSKKTTQPDPSLATAEWADDEFDQPVRVISDEQEVDDIPVAESLLDGPSDRVVVEELFSGTRDTAEDETSLDSRLSRPGSTTAKKFPTKNDDSRVVEKKSSGEKRTSIERKPSYDGVSAHPWAEKAPSAQRQEASEEEVVSVVDEPLPRKRATLAPEELANVEEELVRRPMPGPEDFSESSTDEVLSDSASLALERKRRSEREEEKNPEKIEAQARVRALLSQARSHVRDKDYRAAYRSAQTAQRIADSENLFFTGVEEQPSEVVRSVLMKIRFEEQKLANLDQQGTAPDDLTEEQVTDEEDSPVVLRDWTNQPGVASLDDSDEPTEDQSHSPESWGDAEWRGADLQDQTRESVASTNPWSEQTTVARSSKAEKIGKSNSNREFFANESPDFPNSILEWKNASSKSTAEHSRTSPSVELRGLKESDSTESEVIQAALASGRVHESMTARLDQTPSPLPFPRGTPAPNTVETEAARIRSADSPSLAVGGDWRSQELSDITTNRTPLLVAPIPPAESVAPEPTTVSAADLVGIDVQEPPAQAPDNKLWLILSAAAGAFAMLFIRRRPAPISRSKENGQ